jgi:cell division protein ZapA
MNQIEVQIMGQNYRLGCPAEGEALLREAVGKVDAAMCKIRDAGKVKARDRIAVLAALNLAFEEAETSANKASLSKSLPTGQAEGASDESLNALIERLDAALGVDGRLI